MSFLGDILGGAKDLLFGTKPKSGVKTMYTPEDWRSWSGAMGGSDWQTILNQLVGANRGYLQDIMGKAFSSYAPIMGGTFGGQMGSGAASAVSSQMPYLANIAMQGYGQAQNNALQAMLNSKYGYTKQGSPGLVQTALGGLAGGMGAGLGGSLFGGGGNLGSSLLQSTMATPTKAAQNQNPYLSLSLP